MSLASSFVIPFAEEAEILSSGQWPHRLVRRSTGPEDCQKPSIFRNVTCPFTLYVPSDYRSAYRNCALFPVTASSCYRGSTWFPVFDNVKQASPFGIMDKPPKLPDNCSTRLLSLNQPAVTMARVLKKLECSKPSPCPTDRRAPTPATRIVIGDKACCRLRELIIAYSPRAKSSSTRR